MTSKEIDKVFALTPTERYSYFIKKVADFEEIWSLQKLEYATISNTEGKSLTLVWAKREYAEKVKELCFPDFSSKSMELDDFLNAEYSMESLEQMKYAVMYNGDDYREVDWNTLKKDIEEELENY
ncbi:DUF2750 domain-containing protein [Planococcus sp. SE5232]|uniref:DUF2750 domain-containing protein n=1 Tax=unclassified Planococcus (in: firmicutes) TaxID=2662419 RepID=UPI003D6BBED4